MVVNRFWMVNETIELELMLFVSFNAGFLIELTRFDVDLNLKSCFFSRQKKLFRSSIGGLEAWCSWWQAWCWWLQSIMNSEWLLLFATCSPTFSGFAAIELVSWSSMNAKLIAFCRSLSVCFLQACCASSSSSCLNRWRLTSSLASFSDVGRLAFGFAPCRKSYDTELLKHWFTLPPTDNDGVERLRLCFKTMHSGRVSMVTAVSMR